MKDVLKMALELLAVATYHSPDMQAKRTEVIEQGLKALAHESLEYWNAVEGWVKIDEVRDHMDSVGCGTIYKTAGEGRVPLYTAQRKPMTDEEIASIIVEMNGNEPAAPFWRDLARAIEAAHGIKE